jgi:nitrite reductase/ring-hydroxylating ferredoxin subunit
VTTGANANNPALKMACFPVTVDRGAIFVDLP